MLDTLYFAVLRKTGLRADVLWTHPLLYWRLPLLIPLLLDTHALMRSQYWPRTALEDLQARRLQKLLRSAGHVPYWKALFEKIGIRHGDGRAAFAKLPIVSKKELTDAGYPAITDPRYKDRAHKDRTSGSTGRPFGFLVDRRFVLRTFAVCERMFRIAGGGVRFPVISMRTRPRAGFALIDHEFFFLRSYSSLKNRYDIFVERALTYPDGFILYAFVSPLLELGRLTKERGIALPIRGIIATGEELQPSAKALLEETFKAPITSCYTSQELGWLAFTCENGRLHINEETALIEIVNSAGTPVPAGTEGKVVVTVFDNGVMPFIRYFNGDLGIIDDDNCPCGRSLRTIKIRGREAHIIHLPDRRDVSLLDVSATFDMYFEAVKQYQIIHTRELDFTIKVVPGHSFEVIQGTLERALLYMLHPRALIRWEIVGEIEAAQSSKAIYYIKKF